LSSIFLTAAFRCLGFIYFSFFLTTINTFGGILLRECGLALTPFENSKSFALMVSSLFFLILVYFLLIPLGPFLVGVMNSNNDAVYSAIERAFFKA
jgi:hypothetical protein